MRWVMVVVLASCTGKAHKGDAVLDVAGEDTGAPGTSTPPTDETGGPTATYDAEQVGYVFLTGPEPTQAVVEFLAYGVAVQTGLTATYYEFGACTVGGEGSGSINPPGPIDAGQPTLAFGGDPVALGADGVAALPSWPTGETVALSTTGGVFPAFSVDSLMVVAPPIAPTAPPSGIDRTQDLVITWDAAAAGDVTFALTIDKTSVVCVFDDVGAGTVPAAALATLGSHGTTATLRRTQVGEAVEVEGGRHVQAVATSTATWATQLK